MKGRALAAAVLTGALAATPAHPQASSSTSQKLTLGAYYSRGEYGAMQDTDITYIPLAYEVARYPWVLSITVPWLSVDGPGDVFLEAGNIGRQDAGQQELITEQGLGDMQVAATYQFPPLLEDFAYLDFTLQLKVPTADEERGLGTGEVDLSYQFDLYKTLGDVTLFSTVGYRQRGETPLYDLRDSGYLSLGGMWELEEGQSLGLLYDYREAASSSSREIHELMPFYSWSPDSRWTLMLYTIVGFTSSSADQAFGLQASYSW